METFPRQLDLPRLLKKNSFFFFGPRGTGKSFLVRHTLTKYPVFDLLDDDVYQRLVRRPKRLSEELPDAARWVVIDEIQKLPALLDEAHRLIEARKLHFLLTGSSARKLKRGGMNLLGGRAWEAHLFPLIESEIPNFSLIRYFNRGGLPRIYLSREPDEDLKAYVSLYLKEEVKAEALTRKIENFIRFLDVMGLSNGQELQYQSISNECGVPVRTIENYLSVLQDTLIGFELLPFLATTKRKAITRTKFYFFDVGVAGFLARRGEVKERSKVYGECFEHWLVLETRARLSYRRKNIPLQYWRTKNGYEVDLVLGREAAIEFKATDDAHPNHLRGLRALSEEQKVKQYILVSNDPVSRTLDGIRLLHWKDYLRTLETI
jgi:predicted AAA+ superfamily ATPase